MNHTYYTVKEAAKILNFSTWYIRTMIRKGRINAFRPSGGKGNYRILSTEIERLMQIGFEQNMDTLEKLFEQRKKLKGE